MFGLHLFLEGYSCSRRLLGDVGVLYRTLDEYPDKISMHKIMPPHVQKYLERGKDEWGLSGFVIIAESHIAIHTFPARSFATLDIFSCRDFDCDPAIDFFVERFRVGRYDHRIMQRGVDYPKDLGRSIEIVSADRAKISAAVAAL